MEPNNVLTTKFNIILKPGVLNDNTRNKPHIAKGKNNTRPIPTNIFIANPTPNENKFSNKLRNVLDGLTFAVRDYIIHNLDNEATSQLYKNKLNTGLSQIRADFISTRIAGHTQINNNPGQPTNKPAI